MADQVQQYLSVIRKKLEKVKFLNTVEEKTKVPKEYLAVGVVALLLLFVLFSNGAGLLCNLVGFAIPAYYSFKAIESPNKDDDKQWLVYWVVYSFFTIIETFVSVLLYWIPFYFAFKLAFLTYLAAPQTKGAIFIYDNFLKNMLKKYEGHVDSALDKTAAALKTGADNVTQLAGEVPVKKDL